MKSPLIFFSTFFFGLHSFAQSSFSVDVDFPATPPEETAVLNLNYLEQDEQQNLWLIGRPFFSYDAFLMEEDPMVFLHLDNQGVPATGHAVGIEGISLFRSFGYDYEKGYHAYIYRSPSGPPDIPKNYLVVANFQDGIFWSRRTTNIGYFFGPLGIKGDRVFYYQNTTSSGVGPTDYPPFFGVGCSQLGDGQMVWSKNYTPVYSATPNGLLPVNFAVDIEGNVSMLGLMEGNANNALRFIVKMNDAGHVVDSKGFTNPHLEPRGHCYDSEGNSIVFGIMNDQPGPRLYGDAAFVIKFSPDLEFLWGKRLEAENFDYANMKVSTFPDGRIFFVYVTPGDLPVLAGEISPAGELLNYRGYSFYDPLIKIGTDNSIYFASFYKYLPDGSKDYGPLLAKTDSLGNIEDCPGYSACLELIDIEVAPFPLTWEVEDAPVLPMANVIVEEFPFTTTPYCGSPPPPIPYFHLPDTVCQSACLQPDSLYNHLAHYVEWTISGSGLDTLIADTTFSYCFEEAGTYLVGQEVWLLGCSYAHQRELTVLPPLAAVFNVPDTLCGEPPALLGVEADRPLLGWSWDDGSTSPIRAVYEDGQYAVTVSDGYCSAALSTDFVFAENMLEGYPVQLPPDTVVCAYDLPFLLQASGPYATEFTLLEDGSTGSLFSLPEAGEYTVYTEWEGCPYTAVFRLGVDDCLGKLYWPNAFSPNHDGINDLWAPQSPDLELVQMLVFDRWGSLVWEDHANPVSWDGAGPGGKAVAPGSYVALVRYRHRISGEEGAAWGGVAVVK